MSFIALNQLSHVNHVSNMRHYSLADARMDLAMTPEYVHAPAAVKRRLKLASYNRSRPLRYRLV